MAETLKTYEQFTGGTERTPEKMKAYAQYVKAFVDALGKNSETN